MVYMSGAKSARHTDSIVHRTNVCGGPKKAGTAPSSATFYLNSKQGRLTGAPQSVPRFCISNRTTQTQSTGYYATLSSNMN